MIKKMIGTKIKFIREDRKITQESIASRLGISQTAYSKIESNQTQLTIERLKEIAEILQVPETELISGAPINQFNIEKIEKNFAYINTFIESQKDIYEKLLIEKDAQIQHLKEIIELLKKN
jgi:transcriptional regulator with XRE-family HTH domain